MVHMSFEMAASIFLHLTTLHPKPLSLYLYIGIKEKKMETTIIC